MKHLISQNEMKNLLSRMEEDLKKLETELENIISKYPRYLHNSAEKLSSALDRYYQAH
ncbi:MAG: hypothetical protein ACTSPI_05160 [Candidatus Heimdallarchaeaceae archaeon]